MNCYGPTKTNCKECDAKEKFRNFYDYNNSCICMQGYYDNDNYCLKCNASCFRCYNTPDFCT